MDEAGFFLGGRLDTLFSGLARDFGFGFEVWGVGRICGMGGMKGSSNGAGHRLGSRG